MPLLHVERIGGLAGFGGTRSRLRSQGEIDTSTLSGSEQRAVEALFQRRTTAGSGPVADGFRYRLTRTLSGKTESIEVPESVVPAPVVSCVRDEFV